MPELRKDPVSDTWVVLAPERQRRPQLFNPPVEEHPSPENCPFCEGNESMTPPEIYALRENASNANQPGWRVRVIPNKFPALRVEGNLDRRPDGFYDKMNGIGAHEVVIESPSHTKGMGKMEPAPLTDVFLTFKRRIWDLKKDIRLQYIHIFKGHGPFTGATVPHPHSQLVALPVIPERVKVQLNYGRAHFEARERCIFCDIIHHEKDARKRVVYENTDYILMTPYASRLPFELVIFPKRHMPLFEETADDSLQLLAEIFRAAMARVNKTLDNPAYTMALYNAPFGADCRYYFHWHINITPMLREIGGFEMGTGVFVNPVPPEDAAEILSNASGGQEPF